MFGSIGVAVALATASPVATPAAVQTIVDDRSGGVAGAVNRLVGGIISYVRWPGLAKGTEVSTCTIGEPLLTASLRPSVPGGQPAISNWVATVASVISGQRCDIIYIGRLPTSERLRLINWLRYRPVLTLTDNDPACLSGAAFCLGQRDAGISFSLNIDAITRSTLAVDPRVLELGRAARGEQ